VSHVPPKKPWGGRFEKSAGSFADAFGASLDVDRRLWEADIRGSIAHAKMLGARGIISDEDTEAIVAGLSAIWREIDGGTFPFDLGDEDIHMAIERRLIDTIGPAGGRLHTARSRNDQVATDMRLYAKDAAVGLAGAVCRLRATLIRLAGEHTDTVMPGYTHLQRAQPIVFGHHLLAYAWMLARDVTRLKAAYASADALPLGSAALAGTTFPIDRDAVAAELGFASVTPNSLDAVSDRDFWLDLTYACAVAQTHLSRLCEELVLWSTGEFGFVTLDDAWATGSSIMPQKKNPDFAELVRGKTGRVVGDLTSLLVMLKGLPLAYNKDMQEDKEPAFDAIDTLADSLTAVEGMVSTMRVNADAMRAGATGGFMAATDLADYLVGTGMPFREAHEVVGRLVLSCEREGRTLQELTAAELNAVSPAFGDGATGVVAIDAVVAARTSVGGTAPVRVVEQLAEARVSLDADEAWLAERRLAQG
jgi:argininosuccinate lyase